MAMGLLPRFQIIVLLSAQATADPLQDQEPMRAARRRRLRSFCTRLTRAYHPGATRRTPRPVSRISAGAHSHTRMRNGLYARTTRASPCAIHLTSTREHEGAQAAQRRARLAGAAAHATRRQHSARRTRRPRRTERQLTRRRRLVRAAGERGYLCGSRGGGDDVEGG
jgi:hypothetical protein